MSNATNIPEAVLSNLAQALADVLSQFTGSEWKLTPAAEAAAPDAEAVVYRLQFEGAVTGQAALRMARVQAAAIAAQILGEPAEGALEAFDAERGDALLEAVRAAIKQWGTRLSSSLGPMAIQAAAEAVEIAAPTAAALNVLENGNASPAIAIDFETALVEALAKPPAEQQPAAPAPAAAAPAPAPVAAAPAMPPLPGMGQFDERQLSLVLDVELNVMLRFGQRQLALRDIMDLSSGSVIELDRQVDEPVELLLDGRVIARGEAVIVDGNYGLRVTDIPHPMATQLMN